MTTPQVAVGGTPKELEKGHKRKEGDASYIRIEPEEVYDAGYGDDSPILLRIGNGGAGQSGLVRALSEAFIKYKVGYRPAPCKSAAFRIAWFKSDTTESILYLKEGAVDVAITYTIAAEQLAIKQQIAIKPSYYAFRDHFLLVGPRSNPAELDSGQDIHEMFSQIYIHAESGDTKPLIPFLSRFDESAPTIEELKLSERNNLMFFFPFPKPPVRFLSRFDKSATNIKESELWIGAGQVPWATKYSPWYHQYMAFPIQALGAAAALQEYTLTDRGTYLSVDDDVRSHLTIYKTGTDNEDDPLILPAHILIGKRAKNKEMAQDFAEWVTSADGQNVIADFKKNGELVYSRAPES